MSMIPRGGETIWGGLDWSPEEGYLPSKRKQRNNSTVLADQNEKESLVGEAKTVNYGRIISFGKDVAEVPSPEIKRIEFRVKTLSLSLSVLPFLLIMQWHYLIWNRLKILRFNCIGTTLFPFLLSFSLSFWW